MSTQTGEQTAPSDFIRDIVADGLGGGKLLFCPPPFPPEANGYPPNGPAKSICLNFGIAREFGGVCNLRMDDTNPAKEEVEYAPLRRRANQARPRLRLRPLAGRHGAISRLARPPRQRQPVPRAFGRRESR